MPAACTLPEAQRLAAYGASRLRLPAKSTRLLALAAASEPKTETFPARSPKPSHPRGPGSWRQPAHGWFEGAKLA